MHEHKQEPSQNYPILPISGRSLPDSSSLLEARLNSYLDAICTLMPAHAPALAIAEMRREMRDHLQAARVAFGELGYQPSEALALTLTQFGEPYVVAKHWRQEWEKTLADTHSGTFWPSLKMAAKAWSTAHFLYVVFLCSTIELFSTHVLPFWSRIAGCTLLFGLPLLTGAYIGIRTQRRPVLCALLGYLLSLPVVAFCVLIYLLPLRAMQMTHHISGFGTVAWPLLSKVGVGMYFYSFLVLPIGVASVGVIALGRRVARMYRQAAR